MEEKERFEYYPKQNQLYDKINDELYCLGIKQDKTRLVDFLNLINEDWRTLYERNKEFAEEKDQQITDLQKQLTITEKALELACETLQDINFKLYNTEMNFVDFFKQQAKEMLNNE